MTFDWRAHDLSEGHRIPSSGTTGLELILRARGTGTPVLFVHEATFSGSYIGAYDEAIRSFDLGNRAWRVTSMSESVRSSV
jgi:hypothetical protein